MAEKKVCVEAGKVAGNVVRGASDITATVRKNTSVIGKNLAATCKATGQVLNNARLKLGNLYSRVKTDSKFAFWETKQKESFQKLGQEIFKSIESEEPDALENKTVKDLFEETRNCEKEIQKIKDEMAVQRQKIDLVITLERAETDLKNKDPRIRRVAIRVLERVGAKEAIPYLSKALNDPDPEVRSRAAEVMSRLEGRQEEETEQNRTAALSEQNSAETETGRTSGSVSDDGPKSQDKDINKE